MFRLPKNNSVPQNTKRASASAVLLVILLSVKHITHELVNKATKNKEKVSC